MLVQHDRTVREAWSDNRTATIGGSNLAQRPTRTVELRHPSPAVPSSNHEVNDMRPSLTDATWLVRSSPWAVTPPSYRCPNNEDAPRFDAMFEIPGMRIKIIKSCANLLPLKYIIIDHRVCRLFNLNSVLEQTDFDSRVFDDTNGG
jgi:hypothetical protein